MAAISRIARPPAGLEDLRVAVLTICSRPEDQCRQASGTRCRPAVAVEGEGKSNTQDLTS